MLRSQLRPKALDCSSALGAVIGADSRHVKIGADSSVRDDTIQRKYIRVKTTSFAESVTMQRGTHISLEICILFIYALGE